MQPERCKLPWPAYLAALAAAGIVLASSPSLSATKSYAARSRTQIQSKKPSAAVPHRTAPGVTPKIIPRTIVAAAAAPSVATPTAAQGRDRRISDEETVVTKTGKYTGLIIDTTGLKIERSMAPRIRHADGTDVWNGGEADPNYVIDEGIVIYAKSMDEALLMDRAGSNPLIIKANGRHADNFRSDPLISDEDAETITQTAKKDGYLKKFRVIFLID